VKAPHRVREIRDFTEESVDELKNDPVEVFVLYSRQWDPPGNLLRHAIVRKFWSHFFSFETQMSSFDLDMKFHFKTVAGWTHAGQWIEVHAR
jgi:hypothetical protein